MKSYFCFLNGQEEFSGFCKSGHVTWFACHNRLSRLAV